MRRVTVLAAAGGGVLAIVIGATASHMIFSKSSTTAEAQAELTTGTVAGRWPTPRADAIEPAATAAAPGVQPPATQRAAEAVKPGASCNHPGALGVSRTVQIDTTGGPGFGMLQYRDYDFLQPGEVVLSFDDGPWPVNTPAVLAALEAECLKAVFFPIGKHASWHPAILKEVMAQGHTIGSHTWSHVNLGKKSTQEAKDEIEKGFSAIAIAIGRPPSPFFRFPQLRQTPELKTYLGERNIAAFSIDVDSKDFAIREPDAVVTSIMTKLQKAGKGIILMHDFQHSTALALPQVLQQLKAGGYKVVHVTAKDAVVTLPQYDSAVAALMPQAPAVNARATAGVVRTVSGATN
ncbi:peptidoglycan/xylan/chitin deacetylase (PgdA/CDA1 family) [Rhodopseudomonas rhenobacensis]|uniref:Chitooligosaccharide deacetylase n=1 Tax=Rhodopseudomonas rhenobacensis TaxID=87461 RepID=A0A7W7Z5J3_9BRAD|nr:peptidoglycan/xylan/chitin deacetylase (PgdA/CDA1 family) [Rhodopseudomonas rhenobacensis]